MTHAELLFKAIIDIAWISGVATYYQARMLLLEIAESFPHARLVKPR